MYIHTYFKRFEHSQKIFTLHSSAACVWKQSRVVMLKEYVRGYTLENSFVQELWLVIPSRRNPIIKVDGILGKVSEEIPWDYIMTALLTSLSFCLALLLLTLLLLSLSSSETKVCLHLLPTTQPSQSIHTQRPTLVQKKNGSLSGMVHIRIMHIIIITINIKSL